jgi:hypothetical protein
MQVSRGAARIPAAQEAALPSESRLAVDLDVETCQHVQADSAVRRDLNRVPSDLPSASETLGQYLRHEVAPGLRKLGIKGSRDRFRLELRGYLEWQKSVQNDKSFCELTFNLGAKKSSRVYTRRATCARLWPG